MSIVSKLLVTGAQLMRKQQNHLDQSIFYTLFICYANDALRCQSRLPYSGKVNILPTTKQTQPWKERLYTLPKDCMSFTEGGGGEKKLSRCPSPGATLCRGNIFKCL